MQKAGLVELVDDDRATLLGAFLEMASKLREQQDERQGERPADLLARWRRRGMRAFDQDKEASALVIGISIGARDEGPAEPSL